MWDRWECCNCFRQSPPNNVWGYACDAAVEQGFRNISIMYWLVSDPNRPPEWDELRKKTEPGYKGWEPGPISVYSKVCLDCHKIKVSDYFKKLHGFVIAHDYRHQGGAGAQWNLCCRFDGLFDTYTICAGCRREHHRGRGDYYDQAYKDGWIVIGVGENGSIALCPDCPRKLTINDLLPLQREWKAISDAKHKKDYEELNRITASRQACVQEQQDEPSPFSDSELE